MGHKSRVLLVEDMVPLAQMYEAFLADQPYHLNHVETGQEALAVLADSPPDVVLLDLMLPDMDGLSILEHISNEKMSCAVVVITANASLDTVIEAMRLGALDYLVKPFNEERLQVTLQNVVARRQLSQIVATYRNDIDRHNYQGFIGSSLVMQRVYRIIDSAAGSRATVFITGESGTGKEVCAEAIHRQSPRADKPIVALNCSAIPKDLMESEIFGHVKGAFTGAVADREGAALRAAGGTLFLDEICEMDLSLQSKLLRFIQSGNFQRVGSNKTENADIRFVCATNKDPVVEVAEGRFREDLFYRLHVIPVHMPALKDRDDDVLFIADKLLVETAAEEGKAFKAFDERVRAVFESYSWPGNVRQLQNVVRNIVVLNDGEVVDSAMLPPPLDQVGPEFKSEPVLIADTPVSSLLAMPLKTVPDFFPTTADNLRPLEEMERRIIEHAVKLCGGNVPRAASHLGISASTIYRKRNSWDTGLDRSA